MTIDEAIKHAKKVAEVQEEAAKEWHENQVRKCELIPFAEMDYTHENNCKKCADEHRQLAEWLKELKAYKEQEPCEDAVSRQAALYALDKRFDSIPMEQTTEILLLRKDLRELPSVTLQEQKTGTWITSFHGFPPEPYTACSNCDYDIDFEISKLVKADAFTIKPYRPKFCPNCGAKIAENEEDKES